mgnify:CR=1 FL=1
MRKMKYIIGFIFLFMIIGYATISVSLSIGGDANILSNADDFRVYFSKALLNDEENIFLIKSDKELSFNVSLVELGSVQKISYDVTNASSVFDASLRINCTQGDELISITNEFDTSTNLLAKETRSGVLTLKKILANANSTNQNYSISCKITASPIERTSTNTEIPATPVIKEYRTLKATSLSDTTMFRSSTYKEKIRTITFENAINIRSDEIEQWDISLEQDNSIIAYLSPNEDDSTYYDLYIQSDKTIVANKNMSYWFYKLTYVDSINGLELLDTSNVTSMYAMFYETGYNSPNFTLDLGDKFDTSNVTDMNCMFVRTGYNSTNFTLDLGDKFDTSNVTNMSNMFDKTGYSNPDFILDLGDKFDTSQVTDMTSMFYMTGRSSTIFTIDLGDKFDTSKVTQMGQMFYWTGSNSTKFNISVTIKNPNTSSYSEMFYGAADKTGSQITVNYTSETSSLVDKMISTRTNSNVGKGGQVY